jgi:hypothetical protein
MSRSASSRELISKVMSPPDRSSKGPPGEAIASLRPGAGPRRCRHPSRRRGPRPAPGFGSREGRSERGATTPPNWSSTCRPSRDHFGQISAGTDPTRSRRRRARSGSSPQALRTRYRFEDIRDDPVPASADLVSEETESGHPATPDGTFHHDPTTLTIRIGDRPRHLDDVAPLKYTDLERGVEQVEGPTVVMQNPNVRLARL